MSGVATAIAGSAIVGGIASSDASRRAANTQRDAANQAAALQGQQWQDIQHNISPYLGAGSGATALLSRMLGIGASAPDQSQQNFDPAAYLRANPDVAAAPQYASNPYQHYLDFGRNEGRQFTYTPDAQKQVDAAHNGGGANDPLFGSLLHPFDAQTFNQYKDPGYDFQLQQGQMALQNSQAAGSGVLSGAALKGLVGYNQGMASTAYGNAFDRYRATQQDQFQRLSNVMGLGENAAVGTGNTGAGLAGTIGNTMMGGANASAAGAIGQANALSGAVGGIGQAYALNRLLGRPGGGGGYGPGSAWATQQDALGASGMNYAGGTGGIDG